MSLVGLRRFLVFLMPKKCCAFWGSVSLDATSLLNVCTQDTKSYKLFCHSPCSTTHPACDNYPSGPVSYNYCLLYYVSLGNCIFNLCDMFTTIKKLLYNILLAWTCASLLPWGSIVNWCYILSYWHYIELTVVDSDDSHAINIRS